MCDKAQPGSLVKARTVKTGDTVVHGGFAYRVASVANLSRETRLHTDQGSLVFGKDDLLHVERP